MSTTDKQEFDYYTYMKTHEPDVSQVHRGTDARKQRFEEAILKGRVRIDDDILKQFQQRIPEGESYQESINHALREWLSAQSIKELVRDELHQMLEQVFVSTQGEKQRIV